MQGYHSPGEKGGGGRNAEFIRELTNLKTIGEAS